MADTIAGNNMDFMDTKNIAMNESQGPTFLNKITEFIANPNLHKSMAQIGSGLSAPGSFGHVVGAVTANSIEAKAMQEAEAKLASQRAGLAGQIVSALKDDPTGAKILGDTNDPNSINKITMDNKGINLSLPNPDMTKPYQEFQDTPGENKTLRPNLNFGAAPNPDITAGITTGDVFGLDAVNSPNSKLDARRDLPDFFKAPPKD